MLAVLDFRSLDPVFFWIGPVPIRWYALAYVGGLIFATWYIKRMAETPKLWGAERPTLMPGEADDFFLWGLLGVVVGGRLGYVLFYKPLFYLENPIAIVRTWDGGMSFHGGFLGVVLAAWLYGRWHGKRLDRMLDLGAASVPVGLGLGRLANFMNGELWGKPSDLPWAVIFPGQTVARHPSQLYEALLEGVLLFVAVRIATHQYRALKHPGRASGIFALGYGLSRILVEFVREPDAHVGYLLGAVTLGMVYSLPLVVVGIWLLARSRTPA